MASVEKSEIIGNLKKYRGDSTKPSPEIYPRSPLGNFGREDSAPAMEERPDLQPCDVIVQDVANVQQRRRRGEVPAITFPVHETECPMRQRKQLLCKNQFVQQDPSSHVDHREAGHDDERADEEAL